MNMEKFCGRLNHLLDNGSATITGLAKAMGAKRYDLVKIAEGKAVPSLEEVLKIANFFKVGLDYLVGRDDIGPAEQPSFRDIPLLSKIPDGDPLKATEFHVNEISFPSDIATPYDFGFLVPDDRMNCAGILFLDIVFVKRSDQAKDGDLCLYTIDGQPRIGVLAKSNDGFIFNPANSEFDSDFVAPKAKNFRLVGRITGVWRPDIVSDEEAVDA